ncbi:cbb3-type cytochrome c oxidase subunit I [Enterobacter hormaechei]
MIFFVAMPLVIGLMNVVVPLQIGARDVAFPFLNNLSFWFTVVGVSWLTCHGCGRICSDRLAGLPPLSGIEYSPGVGVDYWIWALQLSGVGTTLTGINFFVTILKMRAPGDDVQDASIPGHFCRQRPDYRVVPNSDRHHRAADPGSRSGYHFFTNDMGGNMMMYIT